MQLRLRGLVLAVALGACAAGAQAVDLMPLLFNTGQDNTKTNQAAGSTDLHYALTTNPNGASSNAIVESNLPGSWLANDASSQWIGPTQNASAGVAVGTYVYTYSLDLTGYNAGTVALAGNWSTDNNGEIYVNGNATGQVTSFEGFGSMHAFTLGPTYFTGGVNLIEFHVVNGATSTNPSGLRVEWGSGSAAPVPEPATMGLAAVGLVAAWRRRACR